MIYESTEINYQTYLTEQSRSSHACFLHTTWVLNVYVIKQLCQQREQHLEAKKGHKLVSADIVWHIV